MTTAPRTREQEKTERGSKPRADPSRGRANEVRGSHRAATCPPLTLPPIPQPSATEIVPPRASTKATRLYKSHAPPPRHQLPPHAPARPDPPSNPQRIPTTSNAPPQPSATPRRPRAPPRSPATPSRPNDLPCTPSTPATSPAAPSRPNDPPRALAHLPRHHPLPHTPTTPHAPPACPPHQQPPPHAPACPDPPSDRPNNSHAPPVSPQRPHTPPTRPATSPADPAQWRGTWKVSMARGRWEGRMEGGRGAWKAGDDGKGARGLGMACRWRVRRMGSGRRRARSEVAREVWEVACGGMQLYYTTVYLID
ncbi:hypothetical protein H0H92_011098 [Tricholoma furcatifolium]|nr:hypothetical protein H0H92_011098 [Tricholoma furcatifolium]